jgi:hypothetical protein
MSEIPFVNQLGDALDAAIAQPRRAARLRFSRRRYLTVALAALAVAGGGAAIAGMLDDPVEIGFGAVGCFDSTEPDGNVAVISDPTKSPVELCAAAVPNAGVEAGDLIACSWQGHGIVVVLRGHRGGCTARGLTPVPASYALGRRRAVALQAVAVAFERDAGCLAPHEFARRLSARLRRGGWKRWRAVAAGGDGPCGRVSVLSGSSMVGSIGPAVDGGNRTIEVKGRAPLRLELALSQPGSPGVRLFDASGAGCFTVPGLERHVRAALAPLKMPIRFRVTSLQSFVGVTGSRGDRYAEGCAIFEGAAAVFPGGRTQIVVDLGQRDAPER